MKYISLAKSRAGWRPDDEPPIRPVKKAAMPRKVEHPKMSAEQSAANTNPDGGEPATNPEEGSA